MHMALVLERFSFSFISNLKKKSIKKLLYQILLCLPPSKQTSSKDHFRDRLKEPLFFEKINKMEFIAFLF